MIAIITTKLSGRVIIVIRVSQGLIVSIMMITPIMVTMAVISWVKLCCSVVLMLSTSLVARLRISPWVRESKYFSGRRSSLLLICSRISNTTFWATPAITYCCT
ncbi:hypothetical protein D3C75_930370 [compost metagenome]